HAHPDRREVAHAEASPRRGGGQDARRAREGRLLGGQAARAAGRAADAGPRPPRTTPTAAPDPPAAALEAESDTAPPSGPPPAGPPRPPRARPRPRRVDRGGAGHVRPDEARRRIRAVAPVRGRRARP